MPLIDDQAKDAALNDIRNNAEVLHICSAEPANHAGIAAVTLGNKTPPTVGAPSDDPTDGRRITVAAITDGSVTGSGTATHFAIEDVTNSRLKATGTITPNQFVTNGNTFTTNALDVRIPDAVAA